jgi:hypothetical protein
LLMPSMKMRHLPPTSPPTPTTCYLLRCPSSSRPWNGCWAD